MNFWELFFRVLPYKPAQALAAAYWQVTRRRVRARNRLRVASGDLPFAYAVWLGNNESPRKLAECAGELIGAWPWRPRFTIVLHGGAGSTPQELERSNRSIEDQIYQCSSVIAAR